MIEFPADTEMCDKNTIVLKYAIRDRELRVELPHNAQVAHVEAQFEVPTLWVEQPTVPSYTTTRVFSIFPTGVVVPPGSRHVGTVLLGHGSLVYHIFEVL